MITSKKSRDLVARMRQTVGTAAGVAGLAFAVNLPADSAKAVTDAGPGVTTSLQLVQNAVKDMGRQARSRLSGQQLAQWFNWRNWNNWRNY